MFVQHDFTGQGIEFLYDNYGRLTNKFYFEAGDNAPSNSVGVPICISLTTGNSASLFVDLLLRGTPLPAGSQFLGFTALSLRKIVSDTRAVVRGAPQGGVVGNANVALGALVANLNSAFGTRIIIQNTPCP